MFLLHNIEQTILVSILESDYIQNEKEIKSVVINPNHFTDLFHKKLATGINRLRELDLPINTDFLRDKFIKANKWSFQEDSDLIEIMTKNPQGTKIMLEKYLKILEENYVQSLDRRFAI